MKKTRQSIIMASILSFVLIFTINAAAQQQTDTDLKSQAFDLAQQGDIAQMKALLDKHPEVAKAIDRHGVTPLHWAIAAGSAPVVELLLAKGAEVNPGDNSSSPAPIAVRQPNIIITRLILERLTDINASYDGKDTLLHIAAKAHNAKAVELLLARGASMYMGNGMGDTPLDIASSGADKDPNVFAVLKREAEARSKIKRNIKGTWTGKYGKYQQYTLTMDLAEDATIKQISQSAGEDSWTIQAQYRVNYAKRPALLEFYKITSPDFKEGRSLWAIIEFTSADMLVFEYLRDYTGKTGEIAPEFFGYEGDEYKVAILKRAH